MSLPASAKPATFIATSDRERAKAFYAGVLGLKQTHEDPFAVVYDAGHGIALRVASVKEHTPQPQTVLGWEVPDIAAAAKALAAKGVVFQRYPGFEQDALGIWTAPGGAAKVAWFLDPDGNNLSLAQH
ncbi:MAG: VOC family protein [Rhizomicrobium sp.]